MKVTITHLKAPWPEGAKVGDVVEVDGEVIPGWAAGKCKPAPVAEQAAATSLTAEEEAAAKAAAEAKAAEELAAAEKAAAEAKASGKPKRG